LSFLPLQPRRPSLDLPTYFPNSSDSSQTLQETPGSRQGLSDLVERTTDRLSADLQQLGFSEWSTAVKNIRQSYILNRSGLSSELDTQSSHVERDARRHSPRLDIIDTDASEQFMQKGEVFFAIALPDDVHVKKRDSFSSDVTSSGPQFTSTNSKSQKSGGAFSYFTGSSRPGVLGEQPPSDYFNSNTTSSYLSYGVSEKYTQLRQNAGLPFIPSSTISNFMQNETVTRNMADPKDQEAAAAVPRRGRTCCVILFILLLVSITIIVSVFTIVFTKDKLAAQIPVPPQPRQEMVHLSSSGAFPLGPNPGACGIFAKEDDFVASLNSEQFGRVEVGADPSSSPSCNMCIMVKGRSGKAIKVHVVDKCAGCQLDEISLSPGAFKQIANRNDTTGRIPINWWRCNSTTVVFGRSKAG